jgi:hypothetical protein
MTYGTVNADLLSASNGESISVGSGQGLINRIINGDCRIDQRNAGASVTPSSGNTYTLDRWEYTGSQASKASLQQSSTAPVGFINSLLVTSLSAYTVGSGETFTIRQKIEGLNITDLAWGTANAKTVTLSFQVYSSLTGTFGGSLQNSGFGRSYPFTYTISSANTWTTISVTVAGDTSGTWLTTNGVGLIINFGLGVGSSSSGTAGAWASSDFRSATGATSVVGTNGATFYITGVSLQKGTQATSFEYRQYGQELALCQRYYIRYGFPVNTPSDGQRFGTAIGSSSTELLGVMPAPVSMRSTPSTSYSSVGIGNSGGIGQLTSLVVSGLFANSINVTGNLSSGVSTNSAYQFRMYSSTAFMDFSSEL